MVVFDKIGCGGFRSVMHALKVRNKTIVVELRVTTGGCYGMAASECMYTRPNENKTKTLSQRSSGNFY